MLATYVTRGVKAGLVAGLVAGLFVAIVANPLVGFADELAHDGDVAGHGHGDAASGDHAAESGGDAEHASAVSAAVTNAVSALSGVLWAILLGGVVFGIGYYFLEPGIPGTGGTKSYLLGIAGFVAVSGAPWLALPPQPAGVEQALPTETRTLVYGGMMVAGALACLCSGYVYGRLCEERGRGPATVAAMAPFALLAILAALSPANPVAGAVPDALANGLVGVVVFGQALLWLVLATTHARLHRRADTGRDDEFATTDADRAVTAD